MPSNSMSASTSISGTSTVVVELVEAHFVEPGFEQRHEPERHVGVFGGVGADLGDRHLVHPLLVLAFADQLADLDVGVVEIAAGQVVEIVVPLAGVEQVAGDHRVERRPGKPHAGRCGARSCRTSDSGRSWRWRGFRGRAAGLSSVAAGSRTGSPAGPRTGT